MKKLLFFLLISSFLISSEPKDLKTLILIIATDDKPAYRELQKIWEAYMNTDPQHFEAYFLRADPNLSVPYVIKSNEIIVKTEEGFVPGILNKTILALEAMQERLHEFDYVIRTNLSSFFPFPNLLNYLKKLPQENCYCGISLFQTKELGVPADFKIIPFVSGAGIILSRDLAKLLIKDHADFEKYKSEVPDDVFIGLFYFRKKIAPIAAQRWDYCSYQLWLDYNHKIEGHAYHFRAKSNYFIRKSDDPFEDELLTLKALLKKYYSIEI